MRKDSAKKFFAIKILINDQGRSSKDINRT